MCYLLLNEDLSNLEQYTSFVNTVIRYTMLHKQILNLFKGFYRDFRRGPDGRLAQPMEGDDRSR